MTKKRKQTKDIELCEVAYDNINENEEVLVDVCPSSLIVEEEEDDVKDILVEEETKTEVKKQTYLEKLQAKTLKK